MNPKAPYTIVLDDNDLAEMDAEARAELEAIYKTESALLAKDWAAFRPDRMRAELALMRTWGLYSWVGPETRRDPASDRLFTLDEALKAAEEYNGGRNQPECGVGFALPAGWAAVTVNYAGYGYSEHINAMYSYARRSEVYHEVLEHGTLTDFRTAVWLGKLTPHADVHEFAGPTVRVLIGGGDSPAIIPLRGNGQQRGVSLRRNEPPLIGDITEMAQAASWYIGSIAERDRRALGYEDTESSNAPEAPQAPPAQPKRKLSAKHRDAFAALKVLADGKPQRPDGGVELQKSAIVRALAAAGLSKQTSVRSREEFEERGALVAASGSTWIFHEATL